jgi:ATP-dependent Clp protease ATP-binding subunit ClpC
LEEGLAARVLDGFDVTVDEVRAQVERIVGQGDETVAGQIPFTPRSKKVLELALREALALGHNYIGTEHVLLGLMREKEGVATQILLELEVDEERVRNAVINALPRGTSDRPRPWRMRRWEYRVEELGEGERLTAESLNPLGEEGWELVAVVGEPPARLVFKRPTR